MVVLDLAGTTTRNMYVKNQLKDAGITNYKNFEELQTNGLNAINNIYRGTPRRVIRVLKQDAKVASRETGKRFEIMHL